MKKQVFLSIILLFALLFCASVPAFADSQDVSGTYVPAGPGTEVISFDISWGVMSFTYTPSWDPSTHTDMGGTWTATGNTVTVTNHSNVDVNVTFTFASVNSLATIVGSTFTYDKSGFNPNSVVKLTAGVVGQVYSADNVTATLTLAGSLPETHEAGSKIGTVSVIVSKAS